MGKNIVVTTKGDTYDYFEDYAFYCEPDDVLSIKNAIDDAYNSQVNPKLKQKILEKYTWEQTAVETLKAYELAMQ
jgi:glycosyltransferase involved in cell wall biosynthesis